MSATLTTEHIAEELNQIGSWWLSAMDDANRFCGEVDAEGRANTNANVGVVYYSRILWFFATTALHYQNQSDKHSLYLQYRETAEHVFKFIIEHFDDPVDGGAFWEISAEHQVINGKKQTYAQCFCIYAFSAYFELTQEQLAIDKAFSYFDLLQSHARDFEYRGYIEALDQRWQPIDDFRLSEKDLNAPKSMNTHLHVLEAFAHLHKVAPSERTREALVDIIDVFVDRICYADPVSVHHFHLNLFFDKHWNCMSDAISFGHDIEASWLLWEALEILNSNELMNRYRLVVLGLARSSLDKGIGLLGQVCDEYRHSANYRDETSYWWVQAEAMVGFLNAFKLTGDAAYLHASQAIWQFINDYHIDKAHGEWFWTATKDQAPEDKNPTYKAGFWKGPYHNGRAMIEVGRLLSKVQAS
ncbi:AGE family epimerase/isomerase [Thalassotalea mangrovi]|uniref:AGE family epimerase/isomerase n=1 Tax=Thalassotalea mangrovi TaxID=2572245 RepID=UPI00145E6FAE|nr:AGE family epimerase/isomerase [Thalassotalea mangrovi]